MKLWPALFAAFWAMGNSGRPSAQIPKLPEEKPKKLSKEEKKHLYKERSERGRKEKKNG